jgi:hypothetical protein
MLSRVRGLTPQNTVIFIINFFGSAQLRNDRFQRLKFELLSPFNIFKNQKIAPITITKTDQKHTLVTDAKSLDVSAPRCHHQEAYQELKSVGPTHNSVAIHPHFHRKS